MEIFGFLMLIINFPLTKQQAENTCIDYKQHLVDINRTLEATEKTTEESFHMLNDKIQEQKSHYEQQNANTIYRLQAMMIQQKRMIDDIVSETAGLEVSSKEQNKTFVSQLQNLNQTVKNLKDSFKEFNQTFVQSAEEMELKFSKINKDLLSLRNVNNQDQQRNIEKFTALKIRQNKTDQNQVRLELMLEEQKQQIAKLMEQIGSQNTVLSEGNTTIWQFLKNMSINQNLTEGQINQQNTQIRTKIQSLETALNSEKTQVSNSIRQFESTVNTLKAKVTQGPTYCSCSWTGYVNWWDREVRYTVSNGKVLAGMLSHHHNHYEDRRFQFYVCSLC